MAEPKRHHYVPRVYLERFAQEGALFVRRREGGTFTTGAANVAVECGFYDVDVDGGSPSKVVEHVLADLEGQAATVFRAIDDSGKAPARGTPDRELIAVYLAIQHTRTPEQRERVLFPDRLATYLAGRELTLQLASAFLRDEHLHFAPSDNEVQAVFDFASVALREDEPLTPSFAMDAMLRSVEQLAPAIDELEWTVEHDRKGRLITSDAPLVIWRPPTRRDEFEGIGLGNAQEIRFPLDPTKQLVLSRRPRPSSVRVNSDRVTNCNVDAVAACYQFVIASPKLERRVREVDMRPHRPVLRFSHGPAYERQPDGTEVYMGDVLHTWVPRR